jgi:hypothetical protein
MRVKPGSLPLVPRLAQAVLRSPVVQNPIEGRVYAVDPEVAGRPWRIGGGRADHLVFLDPNHGGRSAMSPVSRDEAFSVLAAHCLLPPTDQAAAAGRLRRLAQAAQGWRLSLGSLKDAEACFHGALQKGNA